MSTQKGMDCAVASTLLSNRFLAHRQCAKRIAESRHQRAIILHARHEPMIAGRFGGSYSYIFPSSLSHWLHLIVLKVVHGMCVCLCVCACVCVPVMQRTWASFNTNLHASSREASSTARLVCAVGW